MNDGKLREMMAPPAADINSVGQAAEDIEERNHTR